jgi:hypothetical protein
MSESRDPSLKFLWLQGISGKAIHPQLWGRLAEKALPLSTVQQ